IFIASWLAAGVATILFVDAYYFRVVVSTITWSSGAASPDGPFGSTAQQPTPSRGLDTKSLIVVLALVLLDLMVLWFLQRCIKPITDKSLDRTSFNAKFKGFGGTIAATAGGALGSFLTVLAALVSTILILDRFM